MADGDRLLELSRRAQELLDGDSAECQRITESSQLLGLLLVQDVERTEEGVCLKEGVSRDWMVSVHDPEMRHGHKSSSKGFEGHKASVAVGTDSQVLTAVDVLPGNASDNVDALGMVERSEEGTGSEVEETIGDVAYGDGGTRQSFADVGRILIAKLPQRPDSRRFPKEDFRIDLESGTCTCPAGHTTRKVYRMGTCTDRTGRTHQLRAFWFDAAVCGACPLQPLSSTVQYERLLGDSAIINRLRPLLPRRPSHRRMVLRRKELHRSWGRGLLLPRGGTLHPNRQPAVLQRPGTGGGTIGPCRGGRRCLGRGAGPKYPIKPHCDGILHSWQVLQSGGGVTSVSGPSVAPQSIAPYAGPEAVGVWLNDHRLVPRHAASWLREVMATGGGFACTGRRPCAQGNHRLGLAFRYGKWRQGGCTHGSRYGCS